MKIIKFSANLNEYRKVCKLRDFKVDSSERMPRNNYVLNLIAH